MTYTGRLSFPVTAQFTRTPLFTPRNPGVGNGGIAIANPLMAQKAHDHRNSLSSILLSTCLAVLPIGATDELVPGPQSTVDAMSAGARCFPLTTTCKVHHSTISCHLCSCPWGVRVALSVGAVLVVQCCTEVCVLPCREICATVPVAFHTRESWRAMDPGALMCMCL